MDVPALVPDVLMPELDAISDSLASIVAVQVVVAPRMGATPTGATVASVASLLANASASANSSAVVNRWSRDLASDLATTASRAGGKPGL